MALLLTTPRLRSGWPGADPEGSVSRAAAHRIDAHLNPALIRLGVADPADEPLTVPREYRQQMAVERVDVDSPRIIFYRVSVMPSS